MEPTTVTTSDVLRFVNGKFSLDLQSLSAKEKLRRIEHAIACFQKSVQMDLSEHERRILRQRLKESAFWLIEISDHIESQNADGFRGRTAYRLGRAANHNSVRIEQIATMLGMSPQELQAEFARTHG